MNTINFSSKLSIIYEQKEECEVEESKIQTQETPEWPNVDFGD